MQPQPNRTAIWISTIIVFVLIGVAITNLAGSGGSLLGLKRASTVPFSDLLIKTANYRSIEIEPQTGSIRGTTLGGESFESQGPAAESSAWQDLNEAVVQANQHGQPVQLTFRRPPALQNILGLLSMIALPLMLFALVYFMLLRPSMMRR